MNNKPTHVKPALYTFFYELLKDKAKEYGYNLVIHGSLQRDLDMILIPWEEEIKKEPIEVIKEFATILEGSVMDESEENQAYFRKKYHGRSCYVINLNRGGKWNQYKDAQYYLDISVTPRR